MAAIGDGSDASGSARWESPANLLMIPSSRSSLRVERSSSSPWTVTRFGPEPGAGLPATVLPVSPVPYP